MANLVFDFLHNYKTGERRDSDPADAYQYDEGHVFEAVVPVAVTSCEIHYWARGFGEAEAYTPASITQNTDNSYTITGNIPNKFFETYGDLRVYIVVTDGDASITTYEGRIHICERSKPDDYVDDDPDNEATRVLVEARAAAATATAAAETAQDVADSIPEDYSQLSEDVSSLKEDFDNVVSTELNGFLNIELDDLSFIENSAVNSSTGEFYELSNYDRTGYIDVIDFVSVKATKDISSYCLYDANKNRLDGGQNVSPNTDIETNGAKYIVICIAHGFQTTIAVTSVSKTLAYNANAKVDALATDVENINLTVEKQTDLLPMNNYVGAYVKLKDTKQGDIINLKFPQATGNRVYCGGRNLFDGTIRNIAISDKVLVGNNYRGFYCPVKGGLTYTICRSAASSSRFYIGLTETLPEKNTPLIWSIRDGGNNLSYTFRDIASNAKYIVVYLSNSAEDVSNTDFWVVQGSEGGSYEAYDGSIIETNSSSANGLGVNGDTYCWCDSGNIEASLIESVAEFSQRMLAYPAVSNTGNFSIVCAKEHSYLDGTPPCIEYYLIEECGTNRFFFTKDFSVKTPAFVFNGNPLNYAFGILNNGDVIACAIADSLQSGKDDDHRINPYCWLASEKWAVQHTVDFGSSLKPCGWLSSCGFRVLGDGTAMFVEYTRRTVATANVWKITGDPSNAANWSVSKSFAITTEDDNTGFKHIHMVVQDFYTGTVYISTGDDDDNSFIYYTTDGGTTWTQLGTPSQKYCRNLMMIFTENYIYWAADSSGDSVRYLFRAERDQSGVLDWSSIADYIHFGGENAIAAYGISYIPELNAMLILDRADGVKASIPLKLVDLSNENYQTIATLKAPSDTNYVGFRTRFSEWYPHDGVIHFGFGFKVVNNFDNVNHNKGFGNVGYSNTGAGTYNINNLVAKIYKNGSVFGVHFNTLY